MSAGSFQDYVEIMSTASIQLEAISAAADMVTKLFQVVVSILMSVPIKKSARITPFVKTLLEISLVSVTMASKATTAQTLMNVY